MTHVVTSACMNHKYQDCVAVCPVEAIFADTDVPDEEEEWIEKNEVEAADAPIAEGDSPVLGS